MAVTSGPRPANWGWTAPVKTLLAGIALILAVALLLLSRNASGPAPREFPTLTVNPNSAPAAVLSALPRIGPARARAILKARREGAFRSLDDFDRRVHGVGPATVVALRPYLRFDR